MGLRNKSRRREGRRAAKRSRRQAHKDLYAKYAAEGRTKRKGFARKGKRRLAKTADHPNGRCGNIGCSRCNPRNTV